MIIEFVEVATIVFSIATAIKCYKKYEGTGRLIVYLLFFFTCILPLCMDYVIGLPDYTLYNVGGRYNGFIRSFNDPTTRIIYCIFLILLQCIITTNIRFVVKGSSESNNNSLIHQEMYGFEREFEKGNLTRTMRIAAIFVAVLPVIIVVLSGSTNILFAIGWRDYHLYDSVALEGWYSYAEKISYISATSAVLLILMRYDSSKWSLNLYRIIALPLLYMNICIESKRSILFFVLIIAFTVLMYGREIKLKNLVLVGVGALVLVVVYSVYIKTTARYYEGFEALYTTLRIDVFRDDRIKMAIYSIMNPDEIHILDFPFQSYIYQLKYLFFIDILVGKFGMPFFPAIGYNRFFSSALIGANLDSGYSYMTTSLFDEAISNFGFLGFLTSALLCRYVGNLIDKVSKFEKTFLVGVMVLAMMYSPNYILLYIEFTVVLHLSKYIKGRRNS